MRVGFMASAWPKVTETFLLNQAVALLRRGHDLTVYARHRPEKAEDHAIVHEHDLVDRTYYTLDGDDPAQLARATLGLPVWRPTVARELGRSLARGKEGARRIANLHRYLEVGDGDLDAFHAHFGPVGNRWDFLATTTLLDEEPEKPFVVSFYGHDASRMLGRDRDRYARLFSRADTVTVLSEDMETVLADAGCPQDKLRIQPLSIDTDLFSYAPRPDRGDGPVEVLTVARLVEKKGLRFALEALSEVAADVDLRYRIAGDGPLRDALERRTRDLGLEGTVEFLGWQEQEEVRKLLEEAHLFLLPSVTSDDGDKEGTPTVLLEAQARGVPVVSTYHAGIPEIVDEGGSAVLVPPRDSQALADALRDLATSPDRWDEMGKKGRRYVEKRHSLTATADRLEEIYGFDR